MVHHLVVDIVDYEPLAKAEGLAFFKRLLVAQQSL